jgi:hypothetical protein
MRIAQATGEQETVRRAAKTALDLAQRGRCFLATRRSASFMSTATP